MARNQDATADRSASTYNITSAYNMRLVKYPSRRDAEEKAKDAANTSRCYESSKTSSPSSPASTEPLPQHHSCARCRSVGFNPLGSPSTPVHPSPNPGHGILIRPQSTGLQNLSLCFSHHIRCSNISTWLTERCTMVC